MRVIARAIVRSGIALIYSQGFNPHPRLSLPLPRNVGLASDEELFCVKVQSCEAISAAKLIAGQLPGGFELISAEVTEKPVTYVPVEVEYLVKPAEKTADIQKINEKLQAGGEILLERTINSRGDVKTVDVAKFLRLFEVVKDGIRVFCRVLPTGTIRPDEILKLLGMQPDESGSIIRKQVSWQISK